MQAKPNCCSIPNLETVRQIFWLPAWAQILQRCQQCGAYWRLDLEERMNFSGGEDEARQSYTALAPEAAAQLLTPSNNLDGDEQP